MKYSTGAEPSSVRDEAIFSHVMSVLRAHVTRSELRVLRVLRSSCPQRAKGAACIEELMSSSAS